MRVNRHTDYALRVLLYLAARPGERVTTDSLAQGYGISVHHLQKVVRALGELELLDLKRGVGGGVRLIPDPAEVTLGFVVRALEEDIPLLECFDPDSNGCVVAPACGITGAMFAAREAFYAELDRVDLASLVRGRRRARLRDLTAG